MKLVIGKIWLQQQLQTHYTPSIVAEFKRRRKQSDPPQPASVLGGNVNPVPSGMVIAVVSHAKAMSISVDTTRVHPTTERALRYRLRWIPAMILGIAAIIQYSIWHPPQDIRWDGTLAEWPISWMVCCDSLIGFITVLIANLLAWAAFLALAIGSPRYVVFTNLFLLIAFPVSIYAVMLWHYFK